VAPKDYQPANARRRPGGAHQIVIITTPISPQAASTARGGDGKLGHLIRG
jgi:hypothetical protein